MKKIIVFILIIMLSLFFGCAEKESTYNEFSENTESTTTTTIPVETDSTDDTITDLTEPPTPVTPVKENFMAGNLNFTGAEIHYSYIPELSGIYRFDFNINSVENDYKFVLSNDKDEKLIDTQYSYCSDGGVSHELEKNQKYYITLTQVEGDPEYAVKIGVPEKTKQINGNTFSGNLSYIDKRDCYKIKPNISGTYRFDFDITNVNYNYEFEIYGPKEEQVKEADYNWSDNGVSVYLEKDTEYTIYISQKDGLPEYEITIGIPKEKKTIKDGIFTGTINYIDQCDKYSYYLSKGEYQVQFKNINSNAEIKVKILSSKEENIFEHSQSSEPISFDVEEKGTYEIQIEQSNGFTDYEIIFIKI